MMRHHKVYQWYSLHFVPQDFSITHTATVWYTKYYSVRRKEYISQIRSILQHLWSLNSDLVYHSLDKWLPTLRKCLTTVQRRSLGSIPGPTVHMCSTLLCTRLILAIRNSQSAIQQKKRPSPWSLYSIIPGVRLRLCSSPICRCPPCPTPIISQPRIASESPLPQRALELEARKSVGGDRQGSRVSTTKLKIGRHPGYVFLWKYVRLPSS